MPRTLAAIMRPFVNHTSRNRGESYFLSGRVSVIQSDSERFSASVRGTQRYDVSLQLDADRLIVKCTSPYFEGSMEPCKHIWAAILAADQARRFHVPSGLSLEFDDDPMDAADLDDGGDGLLDEEVTPDLGGPTETIAPDRAPLDARGSVPPRDPPYGSTTSIPERHAFGGWT